MGAFAGILPDADVLIRSSDDPLLFLEYHRHFTHSLVFIPVGAAVAAGVGFAVSRGRHRVAELYRPALLGYATHGLLDACTSYGTYLWWPFSDERVAWHLISIVDPVFTVPLVVGMVVAALRRSRLAALLSAAWGLVYLGMGGVQQHRAAVVSEALMAERGHHAERSQVRPSFGNQLVWRAFYEHESRYHVDAIRLPWLGEPRVYEGDSIEALDLDAYITESGFPAETVHDLRRFAHFSADWLIVDPVHEGMISDFRYAMLPNAIAPLWGIDVSHVVAGEHEEFRQINRLTPEMRDTFWDMLAGRPLTP